MKTKTLLFCLTLCAFGLAMSACSGKPTVTTNEANTVANSNANAEPAGTPASGAAQSQAAAAEAVVADLYKQHDGKKSPFFQKKNRALVDKYFTKALADLIWKDATSTDGEVGAIDGDPLYNAQDTEIKNFAVGKADIKGDTATVPVTFTNFGDKKTINFSLKQAGDAWKVDNILYGEGDSLLKWLNDTYPPKLGSEIPRFSGNFQVGDTSCTVKAVSMAFQITWAKGSGYETYVQRGGLTFETVPATGEPNRFDFNDEEFTTGTFTRADGKTFPVKRTN